MDVYSSSGGPIATEQLDIIILKHMNSAAKSLASGKFPRAAILYGNAGSEETDGFSIPACNTPAGVCVSLSQLHRECSSLSLTRHCHL